MLNGSLNVNESKVAANSDVAKEQDPKTTNPATLPVSKPTLVENLNEDAETAAAVDSIPVGKFNHIKFSFRRSPHSAGVHVEVALKLVLSAITQKPQLLQKYPVRLLFSMLNDFNFEIIFCGVCAVEPTTQQLIIKEVCDILDAVNLGFEFNFSTAYQPVGVGRIVKYSRIIVDSQDWPQESSEVSTQNKDQHDNYKNMTFVFKRLTDGNNMALGEAMLAAVSQIKTWDVAENWTAIRYGFVGPSQFFIKVFGLSANDQSTNEFIKADLLRMLSTLMNATGLKLIETTFKTEGFGRTIKVNLPLTIITQAESWPKDLAPPVLRATSIFDNGGKDEAKALAELQSPTEPASKKPADILPNAAAGSAETKDGTNTAAENSTNSSQAQQGKPSDAKAAPEGQIILEFSINKAALHPSNTLQIESLVEVQARWLSDMISAKILGNDIDKANIKFIRSPGNQILAFQLQFSGVKTWATKNHLQIWIQQALQQIKPAQLFVQVNSTFNLPPLGLSKFYSPITGITKTTTFRRDPVGHCLNIEMLFKKNLTP